MQNLDRIKICAVVVTYNRCELLKRCIESLRKQTRKPDLIIVVNNGSNDGTKEWLVQQNDLIKITQENLGGAGGFYTGIKQARKDGFEWVWLLDSDVVPFNDALERIMNSTAFNNKNVGFLSSVVVMPNGELSYINLPYLSHEYDVVDSIVSNRNIPILTSSFGSVLISKEAVEAVGLPAKNFFIWGDDVDYTLRMISKGFLGRLIIDSKAVHYQEKNYKNPFVHMDLFDWKSKYSIRNTTYCTKQKNKVLYNSSLRGNLAALYFLIIIVKSRERISFRELIRIVLFWLEGLFFKPSKDE
jgi:GT2 family glycosyltransferase